MASQSRQITTLQTLIPSLIIGFVGTTLLFLSEFITFTEGYLWTKSLMSNFGGLILASVSIATLWELFSKRAFFDEILEKTGLAEDIRTCGLQGISTNPMKGPDFSRLIRESERLDIFVCYANTWRANYEADLKYLAAKRKARIRLIVPDPSNNEIMIDLARRFSAPSGEEIAGRINRAIEEYKELFRSAGNPDLDFSIWKHQENPVTSFYRFDRAAVITLYKHARGRGTVPTIIADRYGALYEYVETEVDAMIKGTQSRPALAQQIYP